MILPAITRYPSQRMQRDLRFLWAMIDRHERWFIHRVVDRGSTEREGIC